ncbi:prolipoprotein diacylglyceryl transferase [Patescibacteria group bacterium]|nr:prolipoprotein diacylglyceryl transferase [Patescibacteria group bacterium]
MPYFSFSEIAIGPITLQVWGIFVAIGTLMAYLFVLRQAPKKGIDTKIIHNLFIWVFLGGAAGSMLLGQGGLSLLGGVFGVLIAGFLYLKLSKNLHLFFPIADMAVLVAPISIAIGRIGCALINDHQGAETSLPWGIIWPDGAIRHPVAEYLIISALILFFILKYLKPRLQKPGQLFFAFLFLYSLSRFFLDFTRSAGTSLSDPRYFGLFTTQWLSLIILFVIIVIEGRFYKKGRIC